MLTLVGLPLEMSSSASGVHYITYAMMLMGWMTFSIINSFSWPRGSASYPLTSLTYRPTCLPIYLLHNHHPLLTSLSRPTPPTHN